MRDGQNVLSQERLLLKKIRYLCLRKQWPDTFIRNSPEASTGGHGLPHIPFTVQLFLYPLKRARGIFLGVLCQLF